MAGLVPAIYVLDTARGETPDRRNSFRDDDEIDDPMSLPSEVDVAIIGAGAAGLGAAHALENSGLSVIVLEARDRPGGRGHTIQAAPDITFDLGCGWLHSADQNSFVPIAEQPQFRNRQDPSALARAGPESAFPPPQRADFIAALDAFYDRAEQAADRGSEPAATAPPALYLEPGNRWNPMIDAISTYINGVELDRVSILDMDAYEDTEINWRVRRGYGALMAAYGAPCPLALNSAGDADRSFRNAPADRDLARHADGGQGDRHRADQPDRRSNPFASTPRCRKKSTPRAACRSASPTR